MTDEEKLYGAYYKLDRLWSGGKAIKDCIKLRLCQKNISSHG